MKAKKILAFILVVAMSMAATSTVFARGGRMMQGQAAAMQMFNEDGFIVNSRGGCFWQDADGYAAFGAGCWFVDDDGNVISAWGQQVFDADGSLIPWEGRGWGQGRGQGFGCRRFQ